MRIVLVEFTWQANKIINNKEYYKNDVIVSLDPESSYILKKNKIPHFETFMSLLRGGDSPPTPKVL